MTDPTPSSVDPAEIAKFGALAAEWWDPKGPFGALHRINPLRLSYIRDQARLHFGARLAGPKPLSGLKALDLGCGGGLVTLPLARMGADILGLDAASEAVAAARHQAEAMGVSVGFETGTAEAMAASGRRFDLVTALEILEHVADVTAFLKDAAALLAPGGLLVVATINRTAKARALAIVGAEKILKWAPEGAHDYDKLVTPEEIRAGAPDLAWSEPTGLVFDPLGKGWKLSGDSDVNYLMAGAKPE